MTVNHGVPGSSPGWGAKAARNCSLFFCDEIWSPVRLASGERGAKAARNCSLFFVMKFGLCSPLASGERGAEENPVDINVYRVFSF
jgi:hypothetical protein